jgi:hypothetical protein
MDAAAPRPLQLLDERGFLMKRCNRIVGLDGVFREGAREFGSCDRTRFFFGGTSGPSLSMNGGSGDA